MEGLAKAGVPTGVMVGPIIPGLNDSEVPNILKSASDAGASYVTHTILRLPMAVAPIFTDWIEKHYPEKAKRVMARVMMIRGGKLNDSKWGTRMTGTGAYADFMHEIIHALAVKYNLNRSRMPLATHLFRRPGELDLR